MAREEQYQLEKWRNKVLERDNKMCQLCGATNEETQLHVHHIKKYSEYKDLRTDVDNGITLCRKCHEQIHGREEECEKVFKELLKNPIWIRKVIETEKTNYEDICLMDYLTLDKEFTQVANTMIKYIKNGNEFKIYVYLCSLYNKDYDYAFPSLSIIAKDCSMSLKTVKNAINSLCEKGYIIKGKYVNNGGFNNNTYYIRYIVEERVEKEVEVDGEDEKIIIAKDVEEEEVIIDTIIEYKDIK